MITAVVGDYLPKILCPKSQSSWVSRVNIPYAQPLGHTHTRDNIQLNAKVCGKHGKHSIISEERSLQSQEL